MGIHEHQCHHFFTWEPPQGFYASLLHHSMDVGTRRSGRGGGGETRGWESRRKRGGRCTGGGKIGGRRGSQGDRNWKLCMTSCKSKKEQKLGASSEGYRKWEVWTPCPPPSLCPGYCTRPCLWQVIPSKVIKLNRNVSDEYF